MLAMAAALLCLTGWLLAALPGNSGGPVLNSGLEVVGVAFQKGTDAENTYGPLHPPPPLSLSPGTPTSY